MKDCNQCGAANSDAARFCNECGSALTAAAPPPKSRPPVDKGFDNVTIKREQLQKRRRADIMFVLDCTGSMAGEINAIKDSIADFSDTITSHGVRVRVGLIEFRDRFVREEARVLKFGGETFTADPSLFRAQVARLKATGGGDDPESSLDALMLALRQPFSPDANKVIVLITDAPPHIPDLETRNIDEVIKKIRETGLEQLYIVMRTQDRASQVYLKLLDKGTHGLVFELGTGDDFRNRAEHFTRTLMSLGKTISVSTV